MVLLLEVGDQIVPDETPESFLSSPHRPAGSGFPYSLALCTVTRHASVGQEGVGEADPMQVYHCRPRGAMLVVAQPQPLLGILKKPFNCPALLVRLDEGCRRRAPAHPSPTPRTFRAWPFA